MTEKELEEKENEIASSLHVIADDEIEWLEAELPALRKQETQMACVWRFERAMRRDDRLQAIYADLVKVRSAIKYMQERLTALGKNQ